MVINKHIGGIENGKQGIDGAKFQEELLALDMMGKDSISILINSPGGEVIDGMNIYNAILDCKTPIKTINIFVAASIAAVIFQAGSERVMYDYSSLMYHNPYNESGSDDGLDIIKEQLVISVSNRTGVSRAIISDMMDVTTWISAEDAKIAGLCDEVKITKKSKQLNLLDFKNKFEVVSNLMDETIMNNIENNIDEIIFDSLNKNKTKQMKLEITKILNLSEDVEDSVVYNFIQGLIDAKNAKNEMTEDEMKNEIEIEVSPEEKCDEMDYKTLYNELKAKMDEMEAKEKESKINNLVQNAIKNGRIKNDDKSVAVWKNIAKNSFEEAEILIENLPINKKADAKIEIKDEAINEVDPRIKAYLDNPAMGFTINSAINNQLKNKK
jgi:ATP-dependent protease ClpP protease subunit